MLYYTCSRAYDQIRPGNSVYMTIPCPLPTRVVHTNHHEEEEGDKRQSSCYTTTRLTFIHLLLMVKGMYNPRGKWAWNSHIYTVSWSYLIVCSTTYIIQQLNWRLSPSSSWWCPLPPRVVHTLHHEEEVDKRQSSCCIIYVVEHTTRSDQETGYIWLFHTYGIVIYTLFPGLIWSYALLHV
jgi:hypothetical protein